MTKSRDLSNLGGGFIQSQTGAIQRPVAEKLRDVSNIKDFGAKGDGINNDTQAFIRFLSAGGGFVPRGTYAISQVTVSNRFNLICEEGVVFKRRNQNYGANSRLISIAPGAEFSCWVGGTIDGNRAVLKAAYDALNPSLPPSGYRNGWVEYIVQCANVTIKKLRIESVCSYPFVGNGDLLDLDGLYCYNHGSPIVFGYSSFSQAGRVPRPAGASGIGQVVKNVVSDFQNNAGSALIPHCVDFDFCLESYYSSVKSINMQSDTAAASSFQSTITLENCEKCTFDNFVVDRFEVPGTTMLHLGVSCLGVKECRLNPIVSGCDGTMLELNACRDVIVSNPQIDGEMKPNSAGATFYRGDWNEYRTSKSSIGNINCRIEGGYFIRCATPIILRDDGTSIHGTKIIGFLGNGIRFKEEVLNNFFPGRTNPVPNGPFVLENVEVAYCGGSGIISDTQRRASLLNCWVHDNGQNGQFVNGVQASSMDSLDIIGCVVEDTQGITYTNGASYEPQVGTTVSIKLSDHSGVGVGQKIKLVNASTTGDVVGKIIQINNDDSVDLEFPSAVTLTSLNNLTELSGFWSSAGSRDLNGSGAAAISEITATVWITNGSEWRQVVRVFTDNSIRLSSGFSTSFSNQKLSILQVDFLTIKSQGNGLRIFSSVTDCYLSSNTVRNHTNRNYFLSAPANLREGSEYERTETIPITSSTSVLLSNIPANHQLGGVSARVDTSLSPATSWELIRASSTNATIDVLSSALAVSKNTKIFGACPAVNLFNFNNYRIIVVASGASPTSGSITINAQIKVASQKELPSVP
jgi:hypothetical protein